MSNRGWVGILFLIIIFSVLLIGIFGFITYKYSKNLNIVKIPENKVGVSNETIANKVVTTLPESIQKTLPSEISKTSPSIILTRPQVIIQTQPQVYIAPKKVTEECLNFKIESGELKSDRCYSEDDYYDIQRLYSDYKFEVGTIDFIESRIEITCDGSDFFKSSCEDAKKDLSDQKKLIEDLKSKIRKIISRGK